MSTIDDDSQRVLSLTPAQGRIWADQRLRPGSAFYNINRVVTVAGILDIARFERAVSLVCQAHDSLRFRFGESAGVPFQRPTGVNAADVVLVHDVSAQEDPEAAAHEVLRREQVRPLDLVAEGPLRVNVIRAASDRHVILFQTHHIVSDWWAGGVFFRALSRAFNEGVLPRDPAAQYPLYIERQLAEDGRPIKADTKILSSYLGSQLGKLELPYRVDPTVPRRTGASVQLDLGGTDRVRLKSKAVASAASEYMFLLSALACVLHRWTGSEDFTVGVYVADRSTPATTQMIGLLFEGLPIRVAFDSTTTFADVLQQVRHGVLTLLAHPTADPEELAKGLAGPGSGIASLFDLTFQMYPARASAPVLDGLRTRGGRLVQETLHDLMIYAQDMPEGLQLRIQYDASLFTPDAMTAVLSAWRKVLIAAALDETTLVSDFDLQDADSSAVDSRAEGIIDNDSPDLVAALADSFERHASRTALVHGLPGDGVAESWSYAELFQLVSAATRRLASQVGPEATVAILAPVSPAMVAVWLAVVSSGAVVLVLDPDEPAERLRYMLRDSEAQFMICDPDCPAVAFVPADLPRAFLDEVTESMTPASVGDGTTMASGSEPSPPAALIYTSGSTGRPKGVILTRFGLMNQARHRIGLLRLAAGSRMGVTLPQHFVTFPLQVLSGLLAGSEVALFPRRLLVNPTELMDAATAADLEVVELSVAGLDAFVYSAEQRSGASRRGDLRTVLVAGEKLRPRLVRRFKDQFGDVELVNAYGMTETCGMVASATVLDGASYDEGWPTRNCLLEVVDPHGRIVPRGWAGELRVSGRQVSLGYWRKPRLTAEQFADRPDGRSVLTGDRARMTAGGTIEVLGRMDGQLSLRGFRIEPAEISRVIEAFRGVARCEVVLWPLDEADGYLAAYVLADPELDTAALRVHCLAHLPPAMVPRQFVRVEEYPRGRTGKIERGQLPKPTALSSFTRPPESPIEIALASIWQEVIGVDSVSADSDFFDVGGQSLAAVRVVARIDAALGVQLAANAVFEHPSLAALARHVVEQLARDSGVRR